MHPYVLCKAHQGQILERNVECMLPVYLLERAEIGKCDACRRVIDTLQIPINSGLCLKHVWSAAARRKCRG